ncbi:MAG: UxaA family hydrolase [Chloroflexota bacterium]
MRNNALKTHDDDNVAVATRAIARGEAVVVGGEVVCTALEDIQTGHKVVLEPVANGQQVVRYGEPIVQATRDVAQGEWVHVHNTQPIPGDLTA